MFAQPGGNARLTAVSADSAVYLTRQEQGEVLMMRDRDDDGRADEIRTVASGLELVHGITLHDDRMYLVAPTKVWVADVRDGGALSTPELIISDLPDCG